MKQASDNPVLQEFHREVEKKSGIAEDTRAALTKAREIVEAIHSAYTEDNEAFLAGDL